MNTKKNVRLVISRFLAATLLPMGLFQFGESFVQADTTTSAWSGTTSTDWSVAGNWGSGVPSATISALFNSSFSRQPTLTAISTCQGIWLNNGTAQDVTINAASPQVLTNIASATLNGVAGVGIMMTDSGNHNLTIGPNVALVLGNTNGFYNNETTGLLTISGGITTNTAGASATKALVIGGTGTVVISSNVVIADLTVTNTGTLKITNGLFSTTAKTAGNTTVDKGGTLEVDAGGILTIGNASSFVPIANTLNATATLFINGGVLTNNAQNGMQIGRQGYGVLTITNGGILVDTSGTAKGLDLADTGTTQTGGTINLGSGTLMASIIRSAKGTGSSGNAPCFFYFNGGTLKANVGSATTTFFTAGSKVDTEVRNGGGTVDNNGQTITVSQAMLHSAVVGDNLTDGGMTFQGSGTTILSGASTYNGTNAINGGVIQLNASDSGSSGPLGNGGNINFGGGTLQYTVNNNTDYSSRIAAGTSASALKIDENGQIINFGTPLASTQSGGLILTDSAVTKGSLTLNGANAYTGGTTVTAGNLILASSASLASGAVNVNSGSLTLNSGAAIGGAVTMAGGLMFTNTGGGSVNGLTLQSGATVLNLAGDNSGNTLTSGNGLVLNNNNILNLDVETSGGSDQINVTAGAYNDSAVSTSSKVTVNLASIGSGITSAGTIDLITLTGTAAGTVDVTKFSVLPTTMNGFLLSLQSANSGKTLRLVVANTGSPATAFWNGGISTSWGTVANWTTDATGSTSVSAKPGSGSTIVNFSTTSPNNLSTVLDANYDIASLIVNDTSGTVGINLGNNNLTLESPNSILLTTSAGAATISASGSGHYVLPIDQVISNTSGSALTISAPISGAHNLTVNNSGSGVTVLSGNNAHGDTTVNAGELDMNTTGGQAIPGNLTVTSGASAKLLQASQINSAKNVTVSGGTLDLQGHNQTVAGVQLNTAGTLNDSVGGATLAAATLFDIQDGTINAVLGGSAGLKKSTASTVTLSGANTYTGPTVISNGVLVVSSLNKVVGGSLSSSLGTPTTVANGTITLGMGGANGELSYTGSGETSDRVINLAGTTGNAIIDQSGGGLLKFTSNFTESGTVSNSLILRGSGSGELAGVVAASTNTSVAVTGGTWTFSGSGTSTMANLQVKASTLDITNGTVNVTPFSGSTLVDNNATLEVDTNATMNISVGTGASYFPIGNTAGTSSTLLLNGGTVNVATLNGTVVGRVGSGTLTINGGLFSDTSGVARGIDIGDQATSTGGTVNLNGGTLACALIRSVTGNGNSIPCYFNFNGGTLQANAANATFFGDFNGALPTNIIAQVQDNGGAIDNAGHAISIAQPLIHAGNNATDGGLIFKNSSTNPAVTTLTGANTYNGSTALNGGSVNVGVAEAVGVSGPFGVPASPADSLTFGGGTLQYSSANNTDYSARFSTAGGQAVSVDVNGQSITFNTAIQGGGTSLTVTNSTGSGTLTLPTVNTYNGNTTVNGGSLALIGSGSLASANITVATGAVFNVSAVSGGSYTLNNSGTLTLKIGKSGTTSQGQVAAGSKSLVYCGTLTVITNANTSALASGDSFPLFSAASFSGHFTATNLPALPTGLKWNWNSAIGALSVVTAVNPNPTNIVFSVTGNEMTLTWPADHTGWTLQCQTNVMTVGLNVNSNAWFNVPGSTGVNTNYITIDPTQPTVFYRMKL
jgi:autotransporter-associated beta strand protein